MISPLATDLGHVAARPAAEPFDDIRLKMLDQLFAARAAGDVAHTAWKSAWETAASAMRDRVLDAARAALRAAALHSRYPRARLDALCPDEDTAASLLNRLVACGIALEGLESAPTDATTDRRRGAALEQAWDAAVRLAATDGARWRAVASQVEQWRRSMVVLRVASVLLLLAAALVAAWLGGQVAAPAWFQPVHDWWWSLPWP